MRYVIPGRVIVPKRGMVLVYLTKIRVVRQLVSQLMRYDGNASAAKAVGKLMVPRIVKRHEWKKYVKSSVRVLQAQGARLFSYGRVWLKWLYYPKDLAHLPDVDAVSAAVMDVFQTAGILKNDRQIAHTDGSRMMMPDGKGTRLEIWIEKYQPKEGELRG